MAYSIDPRTLHAAQQAILDKECAAARPCRQCGGQAAMAVIASATHLRVELEIRCSRCWMGALRLPLDPMPERTGRGSEYLVGSARELTDRWNVQCAIPIPGKPGEEIL